MVATAPAFRSPASARPALSEERWHVRGEGVQLRPTDVYSVICPVVESFAADYTALAETYALHRGADPNQLRCKLLAPHPPTRRPHLRSTPAPQPGRGTSSSTATAPLWCRHHRRLHDPAHHPGQNRPTTRGRGHRNPTSSSPPLLSPVPQARCCSCASPHTDRPLAMRQASGAIWAAPRFRTVSQLGVTYRRSPLAANGPGTPRRGPLAGDRLPTHPSPGSNRPRCTS